MELCVLATLQSWKACNCRLKMPTIFRTRCVKGKISLPAGSSRYCPRDPQHQEDRRLCPRHHCHIQPLGCLCRTSAASSQPAAAKHAAHAGRALHVALTCVVLAESYLDHFGRQATCQSKSAPLKIISKSLIVPDVVCPEGASW